MLTIKLDIGSKSNQEYSANVIKTELDKAHAGNYRLDLSDLTHVTIIFYSDKEKGKNADDLEHTVKLNENIIYNFNDENSIENSINLNVIPSTGVQI